jgi:hypothetical protein
MGFTKALVRPYRYAIVGSYTLFLKRLSNIENVTGYAHAYNRSSAFRSQHCAHFALKVGVLNQQNIWINTI